MCVTIRYEILKMNMHISTRTQRSIECKLNAKEIIDNILNSRAHAVGVYINTSILSDSFFIYLKYYQWLHFGFVVYALYWKRYISNKCIAKKKRRFDSTYVNTSQYFLSFFSFVFIFSNAWSMEHVQNTRLSFLQSK